MMGTGSAVAGPSAPADIATLVTDLGGDSVVAGIWDARYNVSTQSGGVVCVDDARQTVSTGRYYFPAASAGAIDCGRCTAFDGLTQATWIMWLYRYPADGTVIAVSSNATTSPFRLSFVGSDLKLIPGDGSTLGAVLINGGASLNNGDYLKIAIRYDGTQAAGSRLDMYVDFGDGSSATHIGNNFDTLPASLPTSTTEHLQIGCYGGSGVVTNPLWGCVEEIRMWTGTVLSPAQINAETLSSSPASPNFRYTFDGSATNSGGTAGNDGTVDASIVSVGNHSGYGAPLGAYTPNGLPTYDSVNHKATFSATGSGNALTAGQVANAAEGGTSIVAAEPTVAGSPTMCSYFVGTSSGGELLTTYKNAGNINVWSGFAGPNIAGAALIRCLHSRRSGSGTPTTGIQDGTGAESTVSSASFTTSIPHLVRVGAGPAANPSDIVWHALIVLNGTVTGAQRSTINTWAAANHGATV